MHLPSQISALLVALALVTPVSSTAQANTSANASAATTNARGAGAPVTFVQASLDWDAGRYPESLRQIDVLLRSDNAASERERIALLSGENWHTSMVALMRVRRGGRQTVALSHSRQAEVRGALHEWCR